MSDVSTSDLAIGQTVGSYRLLEVIGEGGMGRVFLAEQLRLGRKVALKVLRREVSSNPSITQRFLAEAKAAASIDDPNIVQVIDVDQLADGRLYFAMEHLVGSDLGDYMRARGRLPLDEAVSIAREIAGALASAHERAVVHRDLKPSNVFLVDAKRSELGVRVKLLDFGVAKLAAAPWDQDGAQSGHNTQTGQVIGTPKYMSPEQALGDRSVGPATDIYSLGCLMFEMVSGRFVFEEENPTLLIFAHVKETARRLSSVAPGIPRELDDLVAKMLEKAASSRPASMEVVREALVALGLTETRISLPRRSPQTITADGAATTGPASASPAAPSGIARVTRMDVRPPPTNFFGSTIAGSLVFFKNDEVRLEKIRETFAFYRDHLSTEYNELSRQMRTAHTLWLACVGLGFAMLLVGLGVLLFGAAGRTPAGVATTMSSALVYFIVRTLQKREDHYRDLRAEKNRNLEYGNDWLLLIQSIDAIQEPGAKMAQQTRLVQVLTAKLERARAERERHPASPAKSVSKAKVKEKTKTTAPKKSGAA